MVATDRLGLAATAISTGTLLALLPRFPPITLYTPDRLVQAALFVTLSLVVTFVTARSRRIDRDRALQKLCR